jgi:proteasome assembly chaperone (PAC2) family protein
MTSTLKDQDHAFSVLTKAAQAAADLGHGELASRMLDVARELIAPSEIGLGTKGVKRRERQLSAVAEVEAELRNHADGAGERARPPTQRPAA